MYNPAIGKFLSFDPLAPEYPELTPYQFASNTPIYAIDLDGLEAIGSDITRRQKEEAVLKAETAEGRERATNDLMDFYTSQALGGAAGGAAGITAAGIWYAGSAAYTYAVYNPVTVIKGVEEAGSFVYGMADQTGTDVPATVGDDAGRATRAAIENIVSPARNQLDDVVRQSSKIDYVTTPEGVSVPTNLEKLGKTFDEIGYEKVQETGQNVIYEIPKADGTGTFYSRLQKVVILEPLILMGIG